MKKTLMTAFLILGFAGMASAANLANIRSKARLERLPSLPSFATYISTLVNVAVSSQNVVLSSGPSIFHTMVVNHNGSVDSKIEIFNARVSTFQGAKELMFVLYGTTHSWSPTVYDIYFDSGIAVNITGNILPSVTPVFRKK